MIVFSEKLKNIGQTWQCWGSLWIDQEHHNIIIVHMHAIEAMHSPGTRPEHTVSSSLKLNTPVSENLRQSFDN